MDLESLRHQLIVSCQALPDEPLYSSFIMGRMAIAAKEGGAKGIRANSVADIVEIEKQVDLPVIGIIKRDYPNSSIYITATMKEAQELIEGTRAEVIALDATHRERPNHEKTVDILAYIHAQGRLAMADISDFDEGVAASQIGFDLISTTMSGYTPYTPKIDDPDIELVQKLARAVSTPIIMEGHTHSPKQVTAGFQAGAFAAVVGGAITRPQQITARYVDQINDFNTDKEKN
ncbi:MAG: N-acetylmannosamine-6-phosphate 2-epimerase [Schleiferilactobacillus perolens]|uniref:N-acetylmannosamine-6-phosphate 2-epimerase n=1 Tax=Schleiferilactobacillus perolens TaxID=100468 RepID=UPI0039E87516